MVESCPQSTPSKGMVVVQVQGGLFIFGLDTSFLKDNPMLEWTPHRSEYLDEFHFLDGFRGFSPDRCPMCTVHSNQNPPLYRCLDCFIGQPVCGMCCLSAHVLHPLHVVEVFFL